ncbi:MAG: hypothetical protein GY870_20505, partial [archaeon]|nr:hypothetical protein [archaeon]
MMENEKTIAETEGVIKKYYDPKYNIIFSFFYLIQGIVQGFPMILPSYIMHVTGDLNFNAAATLAAAGTLPWATKFLIGVLNDKWGSKKYGRRFPFIFFFGIWGGIWFILGGFNI